MKKTYWEKLQDPRWQKKRLEAMSAKDFCCEVCGDSESTLNVHHKEYFVGRSPWEYGLDQLAVLCHNCHESHHNSPDALKIICSVLPIDGPWNRTEIAVFLAGYTYFDYQMLLKLIDGEDCEYFSKLYKSGKNAYENTWSSHV